ncbi:MAG: hypothetical protein LBQ47_04830 [Endomicrobium sp.]|jgi:hypothetical protein|nr:hypothetical protein [Endomicrobium sp.]
MKKILAAACLAVLFVSFSFALEQRYKPPSEKSYEAVLSVLPKLSRAELKLSRQIAAKPANIKLINDIISFIQYRNLINPEIKIPPIYFVFSNENKELRYQGGVYFSGKKIILLNASIINADPKYEAFNFIHFSSILAHEIKHHEDNVLKTKPVSHIESEKNAYAQSVKVLDAFLRMNEDAADTVPIENFYNIVQYAREYIINMRKNYLLIDKAANALLKNKKKICAAFGIDGEIFNLLNFNPEIQFNAKNGGHIVIVESYISDRLQRLRFSINTISDEVEIINTPKEINLFKKQAKNIKIENGQIFIKK